MFGFFKKQSEKERLQVQYRKLLEKAHALSHSNRKASDALQAEAEEIMKRIESLEKG